MSERSVPQLSQASTVEILSTDSNRFEVFTRHRVPRRAHVAVLSGGLPGLIFTGRRWWDVGIPAGLFGPFVEKNGNQDCHQKAQAGKNYIEFCCDLALFSRRGNVSLLGIELFKQRNTVYTWHQLSPSCHRCEKSRKTYRFWFLLCRAKSSLAALHP